MPIAAIATCAFSSASALEVSISRLQFEVFSSGIEARCIQAVGSISSLARDFLLGASHRQVVAFLLALARDCILRLRLGVVLLAGRPCSRLSKGFLHFPFPRATRSTPFRGRGTLLLASLHLDLSRSRLGLAGLQSLTDPARPAPGRVSTAGAVYHWCILLAFSETSNSA